jgi:hypothetical protein
MGYCGKWFSKIITQTAIFYNLILIVKEHNLPKIPQEKWTVAKIPFFF